ncbi:MAG: hypothetical protein LUC49_02705 [Prevotella sp.]|nr:hypothetical protein [Prevotella sp.]
MYGNYKAISRLSNRKFNPFRDYSEHGVVFSDSLHGLGARDLTKWRDIYTFSQRRKNFIENYLKTKNLNNKVHAVGSYIVGAKNFCSKRQLASFKENYGKILLCYPVHSLKDVKNEFDVDEFICSIEKVRDRFDHVFICLHNWDINSPLEEICKGKGYIIVSNGTSSDINFLSRQKDLIQLADMMMSNAIGTHIGYAIAMRTPFYFVNQEIRNIPTSSETQNSYEKVEKAAKDNLIGKVTELFGTFSFEITREQMDFVDIYWGHNEFAPSHDSTQCPVSRG